MVRVSFLSLFFVAVGITSFGQSKESFDFPQTLPQVLQPSFKKDTFNIVKYGAKSDGVFLNTAAINSAINDCNKKGGGVVVIPAGFWLTGPVVLKSNVNLHLQKNALL